MPGTPSRRVFGLFNVYRFILAILIAWVVMEAPHYHVSLSIGWPLVAFLLVYDAILWILSRVVDFVTYGTLLSLIAMALDTLLAALILLQFAFPCISSNRNGEFQRLNSRGSASEIPDFQR